MATHEILEQWDKEKLLFLSKLVQSGANQFSQGGLEDSGCISRQ